MASSNDVSSLVLAAEKLIEQTPPPTLRDILGAYRSQGDGDRDMLLAMLNAKSAEDQRLANIAALQRSILDLYNKETHSGHLPLPPTNGNGGPNGRHYAPPLPSYSHSSSYPERRHSTASSSSHPRAASRSPSPRLSHPMPHHHDHRYSSHHHHHHHLSHARDVGIPVSSSAAYINGGERPRKRSRTSRSPMADDRELPPPASPYSSHSSASPPIGSDYSPRSRSAMTIGSLLTQRAPATSDRVNNLEKGSPLHLEESKSRGLVAAV